MAVVAAVDLSALELLGIGVAAVVAGMMNALAGGGTLLTFPTLTGFGLTATAANVTNTVALCPGYLGGTLAQRDDLRGLGGRLWGLLAVGATGGVVGGILLLSTGQRAFDLLAPFLVLAATALLAAQGRIRTAVERRLDAQVRAAGGIRWWFAMLVFVAAVYGGYFGGALGIVLLGVLGLGVRDSLTRLNALKQAISLAVNVTAALLFAFSGRVEWPAAGVMAVGALAGGFLGGRAAGRISETALRRVVVIIGLAVSVLFFLRLR